MLYDDAVRSGTVLSVGLCSDVVLGCVLRHLVLCCGAAGCAALSWAVLGCSVFSCVLCCVLFAALGALSAMLRWATILRARCDTLLSCAVLCAAEWMAAATAAHSKREQRLKALAASLDPVEEIF